MSDSSLINIDKLCMKRHITYDESHGEKTPISHVCMNLKDHENYCICYFCGYMWKDKIKKDDNDDEEKTLMQYLKL